MVVYGEETPPIMRDTLDDALNVIFGDASVTPEPSEDPDPVEPTEVPGDVEQLVVQIDALLREADAALLAGDLGLYQSKVDEASLLIERLRALVETTP